MMLALLLFALVTSITSICWGVASARACSRAVFLCGQAQKSAAMANEMPPSHAALAKVSAEQAELFSILEKLTTTVTRLSSRQGMRDVRAREANAPPPEGASKAELRKYYGVNGLSHMEIAKRAGS